jgi:hypothetical protein
MTNLKTEKSGGQERMASWRWITGKSKVIGKTWKSWYAVVAPESDNANIKIWDCIWDIDMILNKIEGSYQMAAESQTR